ncbi:MAG: acyl carrier protein [bacterium]|nr:acyl carrier protein [bacterium]
MESNPKISASVREFIVDNFLLGEDDDDFTNNRSFLESGLIDSMGILELISFVEDTYEVEIADDELVPENLDSVDRVTKFIQSKQVA